MVGFINKKVNSDIKRYELEYKKYYLRIQFKDSL
jgi:hypothetical protein